VLCTRFCLIRSQLNSGVMRSSFTLMKVQLIIAVCLVLFFQLLGRAQGQPAKCKPPIEYGNRNQVDPPRSTVRELSGRVISEVRDPAREIAPVPACLGLFTEKRHRLVASVIADEEGRFNFGSIPSGRFRLIVRDPLSLFCLANMPLRVVRSRGNARAIVIHMRPAGIDSCSYGDFK
jgi:hypothetical protein